jgi:1-acyl-sn-glycerol-3-phosphate acyltransferase
MRTLLAALRILLFVVSTLGLYSLWFLLNWAVPNKVYWRQVIFAAWTKSFAWISNMKIDVIGPPPKPPFFLVTNHLSYTDMAAIRAIVPGVFVAKAEIEGWFLAGRIVRDMGTIFIDRTNRRDIPRAGELIMERLDEGEGVIVFPEGTSTKGEEVLPFNSSFLEFAARRDLAVSYAAISYRTPPGELPASLAACWWEDISFFAHLWRLFHVKEYTAVIKFGAEPVVNKDRKVLAAELTRKVSDLFEPVI